MTPDEMVETAEFKGQCVCWERSGLAFLPFADWFFDNGLDEYGAAWKWAATTGLRIYQTLGTDKVPFEVIRAMANRKIEPFTQENIVASYLAAWVAGGGLSWEQVGAADVLLNSTEQVRTLGGYAGTGKTRLLTFLAAHLPGYSVCSFTGKVAALLRKKGIPRARTIHSTIYDREVSPEGRVTWRKKHKRAVGNGFIVDEASMVSKPMLEDMLSFGVPIIAIGDHGQLPPVGEDAGLMKEPMAVLEKIHRNAGPIARFAEFLRQGGEARDWTPREGKGVYVMVGRQVPDTSLRNADQILCAFNKTRVKLNRHVRDLRFLAGDMPRRPGELFTVADNAPRVGDRVICLMNSGSLFNGQQGVVRDVESGLRPEDNTMAFDPDDDPQNTHLFVHYDPAAFNREKVPKNPGRDWRNPVPFDYAYAVTVHKFIGDEADKVIVFEERCGLWEHARWAYTAASRARESVIWVTG